MIVWIDTETTGLDPHTGSLLEIAVVVTDDNFNELGAYSTNVLGADLANLDEFIVGMHTKSGLLDELNEGNGQTLEDVKSDLLVWLEQFGDLSRAPLGGSSVHFDRAWLQVHLPEVIGLLSHRHVDASSFSIVAKSACPKVYAKRRKGQAETAHRALDDIRFSISEAKFYANRLGRRGWFRR